METHIYLFLYGWILCRKLSSSWWQICQHAVSAVRIQDPKGSLLSSNLITAIESWSSTGMAVTARYTKLDCAPKSLNGIIPTAWKHHQQRLLISEPNSTTCSLSQSNTLMHETLLYQMLCWLFDHFGLRLWIRRVISSRYSCNEQFSDLLLAIFMASLVSEAFLIESCWSISSQI